MAPKLIWTPQARADLIDIYLTIGIEQPAAAERFETCCRHELVIGVFETADRD